MTTLRRRLSGIPAGPPEGFVTGADGRLIPMEKVSAFCADRLRRMARSAEFNTPEDPPIVAADLLARRGRAKRGQHTAEVPVEGKVS